MEKLINIENQDGTLLVSSREVAGNFRKQHLHVLEAIDNKVKNFGGIENSIDLFRETTYTHSQNKQEYREYLLTRDGFSFIVMGFTGKKADQWKLKYIKAFNEMEKELKKPRTLSVKEELKLHYRVIEELDEEIIDIRNKIEDIQENMPLFNVECKELQALVRKKGISALGGYRSPAYNCNSLRGKVYSDIQNQLKRQFGVTRYEAIKRMQIEQAKEIITSYKTPLILEENIEITNKQLTICK